MRAIQLNSHDWTDRRYATWNIWALVIPIRSLRACIMSKRERQKQSEREQESKREVGWRHIISIILTWSRQIILRSANIESLSLSLSLSLPLSLSLSLYLRSLSNKSYLVPEIICKFLKKSQKPSFVHTGCAAGRAQSAPAVAPCACLWCSRWALFPHICVARGPLSCRW